MEALNYKIAPKTFKRFVDDSHACFQENSHVDKLLNILHKQYPAIKYTVECEGHKHVISFVEINFTDNILTENTTSKYIEGI